MAINIRRREFIATLGSAAVAWPLAAHAQLPAMPVIGYLTSGAPGLFHADPASAPRAVFVQGLAESGYVEGRNVAIEYRWAEGHYERLPEMAADLVRLQVNVIVTPDSIVTAKAAKAATSTIPIVFGIGADPVAAGLVASLNRPGGNLTGAARLSGELEPKRLQLLHDLIPTARTFALLVNPGNPHGVSGGARTRHQPRYILRPAEPAARRTGARTGDPGDVSIPGVCRRRWPDQLRR